MILTREEILRQLKKDKLAIEPLDEAAIGPASIDLTLDGKLRVFVKQEKPVDAVEGVDYKRYTKAVDISDGYVLQPGELVMGITRERITLPENMCGWLQSRSRFARVGLMSHVTAPFVAPGVSNRQVLEIFNAGPEPVKLVPGVRICHLILSECKGNARYEGLFKEQGLE